MYAQLPFFTANKSGAITHNTYKNNNNNNNNNNNIYQLQLGRHLVAVVITHVHKYEISN